MSLETQETREGNWVMESWLPTVIITTTGYCIRRGLRLIPSEVYRGLPWSSGCSDDTIDTTCEHLIPNGDRRPTRVIGIPFVDNDRPSDIL